MTCEKANPIENTVIILKDAIQLQRSLIEFTSQVFKPADLNRKMQRLLFKPGGGPAGVNPRSAVPSEQEAEVVAQSTVPST